MVVHTTYTAALYNDVYHRALSSVVEGRGDVHAFILLCRNTIHNGPTRHTMQSMEATNKMSSRRLMRKTCAPPRNIHPTSLQSGRQRCLRSGIDAGDHARLYPENRGDEKQHAKQHHRWL